MTITLARKGSLLGFRTTIRTRLHESGALSLYPTTPATHINKNDLITVLRKAQKQFTPSQKIVTTALLPIDAQPFRELGFRDEQNLFVYQKDLTTTSQSAPVNPALPTQILGRRHTNEILTLDADVFGATRQLGRSGFHETRTATDLFRAFGVSQPLLGFALTGQTADTCFLQRLAVKEPFRRQGIGSLLVDATQQWAQSMGCREILVNTERENGPAINFYERLGFKKSVIELTVLATTLGELP